MGVVATMSPLSGGSCKVFLTWLASLQHLHHFPSKVENQTKQTYIITRITVAKRWLLEIVLVTPRQNSNTLTNESFGCCPVGAYRFRCSLPFSKNDTQLIGKHKSLGVEPLLLLLLESLPP